MSKLEECLNKTIELLKEEQYKIEEMSYNKDRIMTILERAEGPINEHLIKIYLWNKDENINHWKQEIFNFLNHIPRLKGTNKFPTYKQLYNWRLTTQFESIQDHTKGYVQSVCYIEKKDIPKYNENNLKNFMCDYYNWLFKELTQDDYMITISEVSNEIDKLLEKYK